MCEEFNGFFIFIKQIKKSWLSSKWTETLDYISCFPLHFFRVLAAASPVCFITTEQSTVKASLFVKKGEILKDGLFSLKM